MSDRKPWRPRMSNDQEFNPFRNATSQSDLWREQVAFDEADEDTAAHQALNEFTDQVESVVDPLDGSALRH